MKFLASLFLIIFSFTGNGQNLDSSLFVSDFEYEVFQQFVKTGKTNLVSLFVCMDVSETEALLVHSEVEKLAIQLKGAGVDKKSEKAKIKLIYKSVHSSMLTKYREDIYFSDIFNTGLYNCVTASALYAVLLDTFQIPYQLKETPNHVYLIADPGTTEMLIARS